MGYYAYTPARGYRLPNSLAEFELLPQYRDACVACIRPFSDGEDDVWNKTPYGTGRLINQVASGATYLVQDAHGNLMLRADNVGGTEWEAHLNDAGLPDDCKRPEASLLMIGGSHPQGTTSGTFVECGGTTSANNFGTTKGEINNTDKFTFRYNESLNFNYHVWDYTETGLTASNHCIAVRLDEGRGINAELFINGVQKTWDTDPGVPTSSGYGINNIRAGTATGFAKAYLTLGVIWRRWIPDLQYISANPAALFRPSLPVWIQTTVAPPATYQGISIAGLPV